MCIAFHSARIAAHAARVAHRRDFVNMDTINCQTCHADLSLDETDVIRLPAAGARYQESEHCCPHCRTVLLREVTMAEDDLPAVPTLMAIGV